MQFQKFKSTESTLDWFFLFFCESVSKLKPESVLNPNKSNSYVLEKPKQTVKTNSQIRETKTRFLKPHGNRD